MIEPGRFNTRTIRSHPDGERVTRILAAALRAVDPYEAVLEHLRLKKDGLLIDGETIKLGDVGRIFLIGAGKACEPMAEAVVDLLGKRLAGGIIIAKDGYAQSGTLAGNVLIVLASHPTPDSRGVEAADRIIGLLGQASQDDLVICLISGGGSALLTSPVPGISLEDIQQLTNQLLASGATINEINTLRKHLDQVKGGQLARLAAPARLVSLIISDVVGDPLDVIASGPTVPDPSMFSEAIDVLKHYSILEGAPRSILEHLHKGTSGAIQETPKSGDPMFGRVSNHVIANNLSAALAALEQAKIEGFNATLLTTYLQGEASQAGRFIASILRQMAFLDQPAVRPACLVIGGETTVTLHGDGLGGRNQELALGATNDLAGLPGVLLVTLATDGGDGPTEAAGAVASGQTYEQALAKGISPRDYLSRNDAYHFFEQLEDLIVTGPTRTNVNDLTFLFTFGD